MYAIGLVRILIGIVGLVWCAKTVLKPDEDEPLRWYDRLLRALGVILLLVFLSFGIPRWLGWRE